jgi:hypothetical protein
VVVSLGFLYLNQGYLTANNIDCKSCPDKSSCTQKSSTDKNDIKAGSEKDIKSGAEDNKSDCTGKGCDGKGCTKDGMKSGEKSGGKENGCDGNKECPRKQKTKDSKNL